MNWLATELKSADRGGWTAVANSPAVVDRDGERILPHAFTWKTATIPVHANHRLDVTALVGRGKPWYDATGTLMIDGTWGSSELAQQTRRAVLDGVLDSMSVVFIDSERRTGDDGVTEITSGELIACDWVSVPSNHGAVVLSARGYQPGSVAEARRYALEARKILAELDAAEQRRVAKVLADADEILRRVGTKSAPPAPRNLFEVWNLRHGKDL